MTRAEKWVAGVVVALVALALLLPAEHVEIALIAQIVVLGALALPAGGYVLWVNRGLTREQSEYLWHMVRRDARVMVSLVSLAVLAVVVLLPRIVPGLPDLIQRPWGILWLVASIDLFAVGLIDDAAIVYRDRRGP
jgi:Zn-dependent protease with chaperone function